MFSHHIIWIILTVLFLDFFPFSYAGRVERGGVRDQRVAGREQPARCRGSAFIHSRANGRDYGSPVGDNDAILVHGGPTAVDDAAAAQDDGAARARAGRRPRGPASGLARRRRDRPQILEPP